MIRRPPRSTLSSSSAASDVYKRQINAEYGELALTSMSDARASRFDPENSGRMSRYHSSGCYNMPSDHPAYKAAYQNAREPGYSYSSFRSEEVYTYQLGGGKVDDDGGELESLRERNAELEKENKELKDGKKWFGGNGNSHEMEVLRKENRELREGKKWFQGDAETERLRDENGELRQQCDELKVKDEENGKTVSWLEEKMQEDADKSADRIKELEAEVETRDGEIEKLKRRVGDLEDSQGGADGALKKLREENDKLEEKKKELKDKNEEKKEDIKKLEKKVKELKDKNDERKDEIKELEKQLDKMKDEKGSGDGQLKQLGDKNAELKDENTKLKSDLNEKERDNQKLASDNKDLSDQLDKKDAINQGLRDDILERQEKENSGGDEMKALKAEKDGLENQNGELQKQLKLEKRDVKDLETDNANLKAKVEAQKTEIEELETQVGELRSGGGGGGDVEEENSNLKQKNKRLQEDLDEEKHDNDKLKKKLKDEEDDNKRLKKDNKKLKKETEEQDDEIQRLKQNSGGNSSASADSGLDAKFDFGDRIYKCLIKSPGVGYRNSPDFKDKDKDGTGPVLGQHIAADAICQGPAAIFIRDSRNRKWLPLSNPKGDTLCFKHVGREDQIEPDKLAKIEYNKGKDKVSKAKDADWFEEQKQAEKQK
eukprot:TRINITY_DN19727_c0_g2_i2.p1 TRINITY_DN19727_c0_g2~~TRINITY_DN19727_c0_g2_i2.p1  ORF type:complete len:659 (+),score=291.54 TRINITY_DN19727_c0_g2_i2:130-2106(+)